MATAPYFHWPSRSSSATSGAPDSDLIAGFGSVAPEMAPAATAADTTALVVSPEHGVPVRARVRRSSSGSGKQQAGGGKKPPQRGLGVAELERLRCGGDPLRELAMPGVDAGAQVHPLMYCNHLHHHHVSAASAFDARYSPSLLAAIHPPAAPAPPRPAGPGCYVHHPAPEQQYFTDRWGRMGPGTGNGAGGEHHQAQLLLPPLAPEHPSSQNTIWRPAASASSSGHRCDLCARRTMSRAFVERGAPPPLAAPPSPTAVPDYSIYDLAAAMATAHQGDAAAFVVRDRKRGALPGEEPAKKEVREIEFFPATTTHHAVGGGGTGPDESEFVAPAVSSSSYGAAGSFAAPPPLDLSLKL